VVLSDQVENVTNAIIRAARTGQADDGRIFVFDLEHETQMRIGEVEKTVDKSVPRKAA